MSNPPRDSVAVILPAAGRGRRFGRESNKLFAVLDNRPLWTLAAESLGRDDRVGRIVLAVDAQDHLRFERQASQLTCSEKITLVGGGRERSDSVASALTSLTDHPTLQWVAIHDAARPLLRPDDWDQVLQRAGASGAAILAAPVTGTLKRRSESGHSCGTLDRSDVWTALTPQVFRKDLICRAHQRHRGRSATDDAQLVERLGHPIEIVAGSSDNLKITYPEDLLVAQAILDYQRKTEK